MIPPIENERPTGVDAMVPSGDPIDIGSVGGTRGPTMQDPPSEGANLAGSFSAEELKKIAADALRNFEDDVSSRAARMKKLREFTEIYAMLSKPKDFPFSGAANVMTPILTGPNLQIQARLFDMIWPIGGKIVFAMPSTTADIENCTVAERFANSYIRYRMPEMAQGLDDTLHQLCLYGSAFRRTYWDAAQGRVRSDWIPIEDFVVAHWRRSQDPSMRDVPRYTLIHHMTMWDLEDYADKGVFANVDGLKAGTADDELGASEMRTAIEKVDGVSESSADTTDEDKPRQVLEVHCKLRLPKRQDVHASMDGRAHPVVITIDESSERVLRIALREEDDPDDVRRFNRESEAYAQYVAQLTGFRSALAEYSNALQVASSQGIDPATLGIDQPQPPPETRQPAPVRKREICFFTHYRAFGSEGFYGLGYGDMLFGLAKATNTILNQHIDGVTLRNAKPGFISRQARMARGNISVSPGQLIEVDAPASVIRDAIMFLDPPMNDPSTVPLIELFKAFADQIAGSSDIMSGQIPGSNQTKAGMQMLTEQAMLPITVFARRVTEAFRHEVEKMWRCWGVFLEDSEIQDVIGDDGMPESIQIGRAMFSPTARIVPAADPRIKSMRMEEAQNALGAALQNPFIQQHPNAAQIVGILTQDFFRAIGSEKVVPLLQPPPPAPQGPPPPKPQYAENAGFLRGEDSPVNPDDDDEIHAADLQDFMNSPEAQTMDKNGRQMAENHLRGHMAAMTEKRGQQREQQINAILQSSGGGGPPVEGPVNNGGVPGPIGQ